jgi:signal transduction histidine kinase
MGFSVTAPFAATQLARIDSFVPAVEAINFVTDLVTAGLLFSMFPIMGIRAVLVLASGYLFSALTIVPHVLSFPGSLTVSGGLFGSGLQTTPWLYSFWHLGFCAAVLVYAFVKDRPHDYMAPSSRPRAILWSITLVVSLVCALTWIAVAGEKFLPRLMVDNVHFSPLANYLTVATLLTSLVALIILKFRQKSILDLWLTVAMVANVAEQAVVSLFIVSRFSVGYYSSRMFSVVVSTIVLIALLSEAIKLYARLARLNIALELERKNRLMNVQAATSLIAHEIRQPLAVIILNADTARMCLEQVPSEVGEVKNLLDDIESASLRATEILTNVRRLFQDADQTQQSIDVNNMILEALRILNRELNDHGVKTDVELASELPLVMGHRVQLQEVLSNLVNNAIDAMAPIKVERRTLKVRTKSEGSNALSIELEDSGPGIEPERLGSIFEPFVTTKLNGTGLGLAICRTIIERHGGRLAASSDGKNGALFQIVLPVEPTVADTGRLE